MKMMQPELQTQENSCETPPTVSVIIPAYNASKYIDEALDSVANQTFKSHEVIVINDGSPDTDELERKVKAYPSRIHYIKQENRGAAAARNAGLRVAKGEFVGFLDADDRWLPNFLEKQLQFLKRSNADFVYSDARLFGDSPVAGRTFMDVQPSRGAVTPERLLSVTVTVLTSAVLARRKPILEVGLFEETMKRGHDFDLWLRLAKFGVRFAYQREVLAEHRLGDSGLSGNTLSQLERTISVFQAIQTRGELTPNEKIALRPTLNKTLAQLSIEKGKDRLLRKDFDGALEYFKESRKSRLSWKVLLVCLGLKIAPETLWRIYSRRHRPQGQLNNGHGKHKGVYPSAQ